jgi:5'-methylthioadenosine nucleosidase
VGTAPAALYTYLAVQAFQPDLVISTGTAGGFKAKGAAIGDVFIASATVNHDRRIAIPGFDRYGVGKLQCVTAPKMRRDLGLKVGCCSSGNSLDWHDMDMKIMLDHEAAVKEMEAASVAWAASMFGVPLLAVKAITDIVDGDQPAHEEFLSNLAAAAQALQGVVPKVVAYIAGKQIQELY